MGSVDFLKKNLSCAGGGDADAVIFANHVRVCSTMANVAAGRVVVPAVGQPAVGNPVGGIAGVADVKPRQVGFGEGRPVCAEYGTAIIRRANLHAESHRPCAPVHLTMVTRRS